MRIDRLDLWRFGKFTDFTLDFGEQKADQPDLHIVYGPNEAGKSTLMAAYLDFLFGFPSQTPYNFKHANKVLKIGAVLSIGDETKEYRRLKKNKESLIDAHERPVSDSAIQQQLAGLGKDSYATMFSLDDDTLEKGGESILASEGDLGKLLYSATTGVAQLSESLLELRTSTADFYAKGKRKFELKSLKDQLKEIETERKQLDTQASGYSRLVKERLEADSRYETLGTEHDNLKLQIRKLQLKKNAFPRLSSLKRLQVEMAPLNNLPAVPAGWYDEVRQLQIGSIEISTRTQDLQEKIASFDESMSSIKLDEAALEANHQWQQIESDRDDYHVACNNLPELQQQIRLCDHEIASCLQKLDRAGFEQPQSLLLKASTQAQLQELIQQNPSLVAQLEAAKQELTTTTNQNNENRERFQLQGGSLSSDSFSDESANENFNHKGPVTFRQGSAAISEVELEAATHSNTELPARRRTLQQQLIALQDELNTKIASLSPWTGDSQALQSLTIPHASELQTIQQRSDAIGSRINEEEISLQTLTKSIEQTRSQQQAYSVTGLVDDTESSRLRRERDAAWVQHRQSLDASTADEFERTLRADDASQATRLQYTETLAQLSQMARDIYVAEESLTKTDSKLKQLRDEQQAVNDDRAQIIAKLSPALSPSMSIAAIDSWIAARADAVQVVTKINTIERELESVEELASSACVALSNSLASAGINADNTSGQPTTTEKLVALLKIANTVIKRETVLSSLREQLLASQHQLDIRKTTVENAQNALDQWSASWQQTCESCWLGQESKTPGTTHSTAVVEEILLQLNKLEQQLDIQSRLQEKITQYQGTIDAFAQSLSELATSLAEPSENLPTDQYYQTFLARIENATAQQQKQKTLQEQKNELMELEKSNHEKHSINLQSIARMNTHFSVKSIDEVELKLQEAKNKYALQQRIASEQQELLDMLAVESLAEATELLDDFDADATQLKLDELERNAADIELQRQEAHTAREQARRAVESVGGDDAVALLTEQRANLLLEIEDKSTRYLQQRLALIAADAALKAYRDNHRSSMMKKASDAFSAISHGQYTRLDTYQDGSSEKLVAIDKHGQSKLSSHLSKGTRFQLYLALRVAGYHEYANSRPSVPFIADDILETSDDGRSERTFEVLGEMARIGQVIYLTHHQHLCDIAKKIIPQCKVHSLE